ncbi:hypothetical protein [Segatella copri]|jgi:hypothetical protein|uniref:Uncharacterized protein n=1 Tax=Segatella copri TaxID=165179 RepID=A0AAW5ID10_9BACT|nr:hypothetical protein [Segatella copri]MCP9546918.1 hypothetical protein [Segatella copri]MCP9549441.1 hypothetical protein [Segatella copri]MCP9554857.1 hypothetical protein [Segatella copri]MCP9569821.1 hypothetical protein [Segatella copri]
MNQQFNDLSANEAIYEAIRQIALHKLVNPKNNVIKNTSRISGYVTKIHTDENDELYGTVDVQEYNDSLANNQAKDEGLPVGLHEGVFLSAIQNNDNGLITIPYLNSDVVIATDPDTLKEYVVAYSHADTVQIDTHTKTIIGVTETKEFEESEDSPDVDQLEKTGLHAHTEYTKEHAKTEVAKSDKNEEKSIFEVTADQIKALHDKAQIVLDAKEILAKYDAKEIVINDQGVYLGSGKATEPAVLGNQLATILIDWLGALSSMLTPTMMGPQPPANVAKFVALQSKINSYKAATSGFLSKTVKVSE